MAKLYFNYAAMNAGKSTTLLQSSFNYRERGMKTVEFTAEIDTRDGDSLIPRVSGSRATQLRSTAGPTFTPLSRNAIATARSLASFLTKRSS